MWGGGGGGGGGVQCLQLLVIVNVWTTKKSLFSTLGHCIIMQEFSYKKQLS